ncbi:MAG: electron transporter [Cyanobacteria bacterium J06559_3]
MFAPLVLVVRNVMGDPDFLKLRGQAIALHSKAITNVCDRLGIDRSQRQAMIRLARDNGKRLGLLA